MSNPPNNLFKFDSVDSLSNVISEVMPELYDLYNSGWEKIYSKKDEINHFILFNHNEISQLDFDIQGNRAFFMICLEFAERLNLQASIPHLIRIADQHSKQIYLNKRLIAGASFIYPRPYSPENIIEKYSFICSLLQEAVDTEEDNSNKCIITFLNYYSAALDQLSNVYRNDLKNIINSSIQGSEYPFLDTISEIVDLDISDSIIAQNKIQSIIDNINNTLVSTSRPYNNELLIEEGTQYSIDLQNVPNSFNCIKKLSDKKASGHRISGRGVQQIQTEQALFDYMRNYGNMHQAKVSSALEEPFPQTFDSKLSLIDWGCGQGLASMIFFDKYGVENIKQIILIEPSEIALKRAALHCKKYAPNVPLRTICKEFDELTSNDIIINEKTTIINLFSNVLDMDSYSVEHLSTLIKSQTMVKQLFVCVSPYIDDIKTNKIDTFVNIMRRGRVDFKLINCKTNTKHTKFWNCNNLATGLARNHGDSRYCRNNTGEPCSNRWTRVLRVFQIINN